MKNNRETTEIEYYKLNSEELKEQYLDAILLDIDREEDMGEITMEKIECIIKRNANCFLKKKMKRSTNKKDLKCEPIWMNTEIKQRIKERKEYNRKKRNSTDPSEIERYNEIYKQKKLEARILIKREKEKYERQITDEIKKDKSGKGWWEQINKLRGKVGSKIKLNAAIYNAEGQKIEDTQMNEKIITFWNKIYQKRRNEIPDIWNEELKQMYKDQIGEDGQVQITYKNNQISCYIPEEITEHMSVLAGRIEGEEGCSIVEMKFNDRELNKQTIHGSLIEHFETLDGQITKEKYMRLEMSPLEVNGERIKRHLKNIKSKKAPGSDGLRGEFFKWMTEREECINALVEAIKDLTTRAEPPETWKESKTVMVPKIHKPTVKDLRPIALTNCGYKIFMSLAKEQIIEHLQRNDKIIELQSGFTSGRRLEDNILILKYCIECSYQEKSSLVITAIDFAKAFDSVDRGMLIKTLMKYECDPQIIDIIARLYKGDTTTIWYEGEQVGDVEVTTGIQQGCTGSPQLFLLVINQIIEKICQTKIGFKTKELYIPALFFADDGLLITRTLEEMSILIRLLKQTSLQGGLEINEKKCKGIIFNKKGRMPKEVENIEIVNEIKYLGILITNKRQCFQEHKRKKLQLAKKLMNLTYSVIAGSTNRLIVGKTYWKSVALPSILHGSAVIEWTTGEMEKLQRVENSVWRGILGAPGYTPITVLQGEIGTSSVKYRDMKTKINYLKHIYEDGNILCRAVLQELEERKLYKGWIMRNKNYAASIGITAYEELKKMKKLAISEKIKRLENEKWKVELEKRVTVRTYAECKHHIKGMVNLYTNDYRSVLLFRCRSNTLNLGWRNRFTEGQVECVRCREEETMEHFLQTCGEYSAIRRKHDMEEKTLSDILAFNHKDDVEVEKRKAYIEEIWRTRRKMIERRMNIDE